MKFDKYYDVYDKYSLVQKKVAKNLVNFIQENKILDEKNIKNILEIGCGTGIFTSEYLKEFKNLENLYLNDIFNVEKYFENIKNSFLEGDITKINIPEVDLILSSSAFQWIENLDELFKKLSTSSNNLIFSTYTKGNLIEIKKHFGISLNYYEIEEIKNILEKYFKNIKEKKETIILEFENPLEVLKHLKYTGVTGLKKPSITNIRSFDKNKITYEVAYFICEKGKL